MQYIGDLMKVLKICINEWKNASRDERELSLCKEMGMDVVVIAKGSQTGKPVWDNVDGFKVFRISARPMGTSVPLALNRVVSIFLWAHYAKQLHADIISGHDYSGLFIGWLSNMFRLRKAKLVYDSHELEYARNVQRSKIQTIIVKILERFLIKRSVFTIIPCDSAADELKQIYHLKNRPIVVRSTPEYHNIDEKKKNLIRTQYIDYFEEKIDFIVMYHGGIMENRGIEQIIDAVSMMPTVGLVILGDPQRKEYLEAIIERIHTNKLEDRVYYHKAVPHSELFNYVAAADVGMATIIPKTKSYYYCLPNKFFENIQSLTPIIINDLPEMKRIVTKYNIGIVTEGMNSVNIMDAIKKMKNNKSDYQIYKTNLQKAKEELCWESEKEILRKAYAEIKII